MATLLNLLGKPKSIDARYGHVAFHKTPKGTSNMAESGFYINHRLKDIVISFYMLKQTDHEKVPTYMLPVILVFLFQNL